MICTLVVFNLLPYGVGIVSPKVPMLGMASKNKFHVFEVVLDSGTKAFAVDSVGDRDTWVQSIQALRDAQNYSKSTYSTTCRGLILN